MSILKIKDSQGNWVGVPTVKGDTGNGISSAVLNNDYTLTLTFTDGTTYTTPSIRGEKGEQGEPATDMDIHICSASEYDSETRIPTITSPDDKTFYLVPTEDGTSPDLFTEWVYVNNAWEMFGSAKIDLSEYLTDVKVNGTSIVDENGVANVPIAGANELGVLQTQATYGLNITRTGMLYVAGADSAETKSASSTYKPVVVRRQHESTFYGLAKAAGADEKDSTLAFGTYSDNAKSSIQNMLGITDKYSPKEWVAESETELVTNAHSVGDLFYIGETLYKVIADLNAGDAINVGVNVEEVNANDILDDYATKEDVQDNVSIVEKSASGSVASFNDGMDDMPLKSLTVNIDPVQDTSSGDPSPENICPISGWTECNLNKTGVNIWNKTLINGDVDIDVISGVVYTVSAKASSNAYLYLRRRAVGTSDYSRVAWVLSNTTSGMATFTPEEGYVYSLWSNATSYPKISDVQLEVGSTATPYEPYNGTTIPISWQTEAGTVYGGRLDVLSGVMTITHQIKTFDGTEAWSQTGAGKFYVNKSLTDFDVYNSGWISNKYPYGGFNTLSSNMVIDKSFYTNHNTDDRFQDRIFVFDSSFADVDAFKSSLVANPLTVCGMLKEPLEVQLDAHAVNSLLGVNNIFADTGDTEVEYFSQVDKDLIDYIETSLKPYAKEERLNDYVSDVQINGTSIVENGVAEIPLANTSIAGVVKINNGYGIITSPNGELFINTALNSDAQIGTNINKPITPYSQHASVFYGLAKASGVDEKDSTLPLGTYTDEAKTAIKQMLDIHDTIDSFVEEITGTDVTITGQPSYRYNCGELYSLTVTPPESGTIDIRFTSGSTPTVLTLPSTVKMPEWWVEVEANTIYEMCITDGIYCGVMSWAV